MTVTDLIQPFRKGESRDARLAKIAKINEITEQLAAMITKGDVIGVGAITSQLDRAGVLINPDDPSLWQAEEME